MKYSKLGDTDIKVSKICLGTMTWGEQNTEEEAHQQLDFAVNNGVNFIDTAEMYPVPPNGQTSGKTEEFIGSWLSNRKKRDDIVLATKVIGRSQNTYYRGGETRLDRDNIEKAIDASLKRLQTDYVDLYQLHWPDRKTNFLGQLGYVHDDQDSFIPLEETLSVLGDLVKKGKVRHVGLSNETPWGIMEFIRLSKEKGLSRMQSVQNPYNLLNRTYEIGMAEISIREKCGLLAYSPLGMGVLSGKYLGGKKPEGARLTIFSRWQRYTHLRAVAATEKYVELAKESNLDTVQMALSYINSRPFVTSNIIGATTLEQLKSNIESIDIGLSDDVMVGIEEIHDEDANPCP